MVVGAVSVCAGCGPVSFLPFLVVGFVLPLCPLFYPDRAVNDRVQAYQNSLYGVPGRARAHIEYHALQIITDTREIAKDRWHRLHFLLERPR